MDKGTQKKLLDLNYKLYEDKAIEWDKTRKNLWEKPILDFIKTIKPNSKILDLGCGNGRLYSKISNLIANSQKLKANYLGIDPSKELIKICRGKYIDPSLSLRMTPKFKVGNGLDMNFDRKFDYVISLAVLHHIPGENLQKKFLKNIYNALKPNGKLFLSVWNRNHTRHQYKNSLKLFKDMDKSDILVPWRKSNNFRYIHIFSPDKLHKIVQNAGFKNMHVIFESQKNISSSFNIYLTGQKI